MLITLIYLGGVWAAEEAGKPALWCFVWPWYLGRKLAEYACSPA